MQKGGEFTKKGRKRGISEKRKGCFGEEKGMFRGRERDVSGKGKGRFGEGKEAFRVGKSRRELGFGGR